jgi:hypothetical protein
VLSVCAGHDVIELTDSCARQAVQWPVDATVCYIEPDGMPGLMEPRDAV